MGATGVLPTWGWGHHYVNALASFLVSLQPGLAKSIDYILPDTIHWMENGAAKTECISRPMKYAKCQPRATFAHRPDGALLGTLR